MSPLHTHPTPRPLPLAIFSRDGVSPPYHFPVRVCVCVFSVSNETKPDVGGEKVSITRNDLQTSPNTFEIPLWTYPVLLTGDAVDGEIEILAE